MNKITIKFGTELKPTKHIVVNYNFTQLIGFVMMSVFMFALAIKYEYFKAHVPLFALLYGLTFFFANFGLNSTTFVLPAKLFPTWVRSTCHAMSTAAGKAGAMVGAFGV